MKEEFDPLFYQKYLMFLCLLGGICMHKLGKGKEISGVPKIANWIVSHSIYSSIYIKILGSCRWSSRARLERSIPNNKGKFKGSSV